MIKIFTQNSTVIIMVVIELVIVNSCGALISHRLEIKSEERSPIEFRAPFALVS